MRLCVRSLNYKELYKELQFIQSIKEVKHKEKVYVLVPTLSEITTKNHKCCTHAQIRYYCEIVIKFECDKQ